MRLPLYIVAPEIVDLFGGEGATNTLLSELFTTYDCVVCDKTVQLEEGEFIVVPRGVEHKPVADEECWILLFEPASTLNTGNVENERTQRELQKI